MPYSVRGFFISEEKNPTAKLEGRPGSVVAPVSEPWPHPVAACLVRVGVIAREHCYAAVDLFSEYRSPVA